MAKFFSGEKKARHTALSRLRPGFDSRTGHNNYKPLNSNFLMELEKIVNYAAGASLFSLGVVGIYKLIIEPTIYKYIQKIKMNYKKNYNSKKDSVNH